MQVNAFQQTITAQYNSNTATLPSRRWETPYENLIQNLAHGIDSTGLRTTWLLCFSRPCAEEPNDEHSAMNPTHPGNQRTLRTISIRNNNNTTTNSPVAKSACPWPEAGPSCFSRFQARVSDGSPRPWLIGSHVLPAKAPDDIRRRTQNWSVSHAEANVRVAVQERNPPNDRCRSGRWPDASIGLLWAGYLPGWVKALEPWIWFGKLLRRAKVNALAIASFISSESRVTPVVCVKWKAVECNNSQLSGAMQ